MTDDEAYALAEQSAADPVWRGNPLNGYNAGRRMFLEGRSSIECPPTSLMQAGWFDALADAVRRYHGDELGRALDSMRKEGLTP